MKPQKTTVPWTIFVLFLIGPFLLFFSRPFVDLKADVSTLSPFDWFTYLLYWTCAVFVLRQMRFVWVMSVLLLAISVFTTGLQAFIHFNDASFLPMSIQFILSFGMMCVLMIVIQYFNQGIFDQRDQGSILGAAERKDVQCEGVITSKSGETFSVQVRSISMSGARIEISSAPDPFYLRQWKIEIPVYQIKDLEFEFVEISKKSTARIQFINSNVIKTWQLYRKIKAS